MSDDTNHTLRLLREIRAGQQETLERLGDVEQAVSGLAYIVARNHGEFAALEDRVAALETTVATLTD